MLVFFHAVWCPFSADVAPFVLLYLAEHPEIQVVFLDGVCTSCIAVFAWLSSVASTARETVAPRMQGCIYYSSLLC